MDSNAVMGAVWMFTPWLLTAVGWQRWIKAGCPAKGTILVGNVLATISCCQVIPFLIVVASGWSRVHVNILEVSFFVTAPCGFFAILLLPWAQLKAKWLAFVAAGMNLLFAATMIMALGDT